MIFGAGYIRVTIACADNRTPSQVLIAMSSE